MSIRVASVICVLVLALAPAALANGKKYALVVGVNEYQVNSLPSLKYAENDADELAKALVGYEITVLTSGRGKTKKDQLPTATHVREALAKLMKGKGKHDTVLIAFAGHGVQLEVSDPAGKESDKSFPYFCPADAQLNEAEYKTGKSPTLINLDHLMEDLGGCGAGVKLLLVDACRNEIRARQGVTPAGFKIPAGVGVLFSCSKGQRAFETNKLGKGHGVFFYHVIEALKDEDKLTWTRLADRVIDKVTDDVPKVIGDGAKQTPHKIENIEGRSPLVVERPANDDRLFRQGLDSFAGLTEEMDAEKALARFADAAKKGHELAEAWHAIMTYKGLGTEIDEAKGLERIKAILPALRKKADANDADAQFLLGAFLADGLGTDQDAKAAVTWYRKAQAGGSIEAMNNLGFMYENGRGIDKDEKEAAHWYQKAADKGHAAAMNNLGSMYADGDGVPKDEKKAVELLRESAKKGHAAAMNNLGLLHKDGRGVKQDAKEAVAWFRKAADKGYAPAMCNLGQMYQKGLGVDLSRKDALAWYKKAAELGDEDAKKLAEELKKNG